jgi:hypothetical protein
MQAIAGVLFGGNGTCILLDDKRFRAWKIDEPQLPPASVQDFVAEDHLARLVVSLATEELDWSRSRPVISARKGSRHLIRR